MKKPVKLYYSISEVAEITNLQAYTLRSWEKEFSCLRPRRVHGKNRSYRERDIGIVLRIKRLLYDERYTIQGASRKLKSEPELLRNLEAETAFLHELPPAQGVATGVAEHGEAPASVAVPETGDGESDADLSASEPDGLAAAADGATTDHSAALGDGDAVPARARERQLRELLDGTRRELRELLQILQ